TKKVPPTVAQCFRVTQRRCGAVLRPGLSVAAEKNVEVPPPQLRASGSRPSAADSRSGFEASALQPCGVRQLRSSELARSAAGKPPCEGAQFRPADRCTLPQESPGCARHRSEKTTLYEPGGRNYPKDSRSVGGKNESQKAGSRVAPGG